MQTTPKTRADVSVHEPECIDELLDVIAKFQNSLRAHVQPYSHRNSPKLFTQVQLLTLLALKAYTNKTYRGLLDFIKNCEAVRERICPGHLPHYSTLKRFSDRIGGVAITDQLICSVIHWEAGRQRRSRSAPGPTVHSASHQLSR